MGELTTMERAQRALAQRTSRRGFLGRVGRGVVALAGGSLVADGARPGSGRGVPHLWPHLDDRVVSPSVTRPSRGPTAIGFPVHPTSGYPVDDRGKLYRDRATQDAIEDLPGEGPRGLRLRERRPVRRRLDAVLLWAAAPHPGLLLPVDDPDQRGLRRARLLSRRVQGLLHHVPGAREVVLTDAGTAALTVAAAIAGWSALWGP